MGIPHVDVKAQYAPLLDELKQRLAAALESGQFILGPEVRAFEDESADFLGARQAVGVGWNAARGEAAARSAEVGLSRLCELPEDEPGHVYHMYVARSPGCDRIADVLRAAEIGCATSDTTPPHLQPVYAGLAYRPGSLPETERAARDSRPSPVGWNLRGAAGGGRGDDQSAKREESGS